MYRASLKALGLDKDDIARELDNAAHEWTAKNKPREDTRYKKSIDWLDDYLKR